MLNNIIPIHVNTYVILIVIGILLLLIGLWIIPSRYDWHPDKKIRALKRTIGIILIGISIPNCLYAINQIQKQAEEAPGNIMQQFQEEINTKTTFIKKEGNKIYVKDTKNQQYEITYTDNIIIQYREIPEKQ